MPYAPGITYDTSSIGNAIGGLGQNLAQGFKDYQVNQAKDKEAEGIVAGILQSNPDVLKGADDKTLKLLEKFKNGDTGLKDNIFLAGWASMTQKGLEKKQQMEAQQLQLQQLQTQAAQQRAAQQFIAQAQQAQNGATGPLNNAAYKQFMSPMAQDAVSLAKFSGKAPDQDVLARMQENRTTNDARVAAKGTPLVFSSEKELTDKYPTAKFEYNFAPLPDGRVVIPDGKISGRAPAPVQPEVPNPLVEKIYSNLATERTATVAPALRGLQAYSQIDKIINSPDTKIVSGRFANQELLFKRIANVLGAKNADVTNTQVVQALFSGPMAAYIKNLGAGTGISDNDREYALRAVGGELTLDADSIKRLVRIGQQAAKDIAKDYQDRLDETFPEKSDNASYRQARAALRIPSQQAATSPARAMLEEMGIK